MDAKVAANKDAELTYQTVKLTDDEVNALAEANVKEAYKVVSVNKEGIKTTVGDIIKIYKDSSLKSIDYVKVDDKKKAGQFLKYVYTLENGTEKTVYVDMSELVDQAEVEKGIQAIDGKLSIKIAEGNEADFLTVDANGLKLSGVQTAINNAQKAVQDNLNAEITRAKAAEDKIEASVGLAANGSHVSSQGHYTNSATTVVGEIAALDTQVYTNTGAIATVRGIADKNTQDIATLDGKLAVASAVTVKGSTNITVTESQEGNDNHKAFTVEAKDLATTAQHDALAARVTNTEASINTLNGAATVTGSVDNKIASALSWIEGGTY